MTSLQAVRALHQSGQLTLEMLEGFEALMAPVVFARGGGGAKGGAKAKADSGGLLGQVAGVVGGVGTGGCGTGTRSGKRGFQKGNKCASKDKRSATGTRTAAARSKHTAAVKVARSHLTAARKSGTTLSKEGRAAVKTAAQAHRELQAARVEHKEATRQTRNLKAREARAAVKAAKTAPETQTRTATLIRPPAATKPPAPDRKEAKKVLEKAKVTPKPGEKKPTEKKTTEKKTAEKKTTEKSKSPWTISKNPHELGSSKYVEHEIDTLVKKLATGKMKDNRNLVSKVRNVLKTASGDKLEEGVRAAGLKNFTQHYKYHVQTNKVVQHVKEKAAELGAPPAKPAKPSAKPKVDKQAAAKAKADKTAATAKAKEAKTAATAKAKADKAAATAKAKADKAEATAKAKAEKAAAAKAAKQAKAKERAEKSAKDADELKSKAKNKAKDQDQAKLATKAARAAHVAKARADIDAAIAQHGHVAPAGKIADRVANDKISALKHEKIMEIDAIYQKQMAGLVAKQKAMESESWDLIAKLRMAEDAFAAKPKDQARIAAVQKATEAFEAHLAIKKPLKDRINAIKDQADHDAHAILAAHSPTKISNLGPDGITTTLHPTSYQARKIPLTTDHHKIIADGEAFVSKIHHDPQKTGVKVEYGVSATGRAFADYGENARGDPSGFIAAGRMHSSSIVHEHGHLLENQVPGLKKMAGDFVEHRVGKEKFVSLRDATGNKDFDASEMGRKDDFLKTFDGNDQRAYYAGKVYSDGSTEIVSLGLEELHVDPVGFARRDPEYFKFIAGVAGGHLR